MKISKQLKTQIRQSTYDIVFNYLCLLDHLDRTNKITHDAWQKTHEPACGLTGEISDKIIRDIENYSR